VETLEHITTSPALEPDWKRIEALTGETVIFESKAEDIGITRLNLTKGLIKQSVVNNLNKLSSNNFLGKEKGHNEAIQVVRYYGSPSTSTEKKQLHKIDVGPHD
ncbi:17463_t:CDS:2, partial [Gigaspora margarita]